MVTVGADSQAGRSVFQRWRFELRGLGEANIVSLRYLWQLTGNTKGGAGCPIKFAMSQSSACLVRGFDCLRPGSAREHALDKGPV